MQELSKDGFLAHHVGGVRGQPVTVADIIRIGAHVFGAVHTFAPDSEVEEHLAKLASDHTIGPAPGIDVVLAQVPAICAVAERGLRPLGRLVKARLIGRDTSDPALRDKLLNHPLDQMDDNPFPFCIEFGRGEPEKGGSDRNE